LKLRNEEELRNVLGAAFSTFSSGVANGGLVGPFLSMLDGVDSVDVTVALRDNGSIHVTLIPVVEPIVCQEAIMVQEEPTVETAPIEESEDKPKRRKKQIENSDISDP